MLCGDKGQDGVQVPYAFPLPRETQHTRRYPEGSVSRHEHMQCHALYLWLWPRPGGMRLQLFDTRRVAGQRHQRTLPVVTPAWPSPGASARSPRAAARAAARGSKRRAARWKKC